MPYFFVILFIANFLYKFRTSRITIWVMYLFKVRFYLQPSFLFRMSYLSVYKGNQNWCKTASRTCFGTLRQEVVQALYCTNLIASVKDTKVACNCIYLIISCFKYFYVGNIINKVLKYWMNKLLFLLKYKSQKTL